MPGGEHSRGGDLNGDGNLDVLAPVLPNAFCISLGNGDGTLQVPTLYETEEYDPLSAAAADVNGDGKLDVLVTNWCPDNSEDCYISGQPPGSVSVFVNITPSPYNAFVQPPINTDGSSIFKANRGVISVKFSLTKNDAPTCDLPPATIAVKKNCRCDSRRD